MLTSSPINCSNGLKILLKWGIAVTLQEAGQLKLEKIVTLRQYYFQLPLFALKTLHSFMSLDMNLMYLFILLVLFTRK